MANSVQIPSKIDSARLDALIVALRKTARNSRLIEHLETARAYLNGGLSLKCAASLDLARQASGHLSDKTLARQSESVIGELLAHLPQTPDRSTGFEQGPGPQREVDSLEVGRSATAVELAAYFSSSGGKPGSFYPTEHMVVVFESFDLAFRGLRRLPSGGPNANRVLVASGEEFGKFLEDLRIGQDLHGVATTEGSGTLDEEGRLVDEYVGWARSGGGFMFALSPTETAAWKMLGNLIDLSPLAAQWFSTNSVQRLI